MITEQTKHHLTEAENKVAEAIKICIQGIAGSSDHNSQIETARYLLTLLSFADNDFFIQNSKELLAIIPALQVMQLKSKSVAVGLSFICSKLDSQGGTPISKVMLAAGVQAVGRETIDDQTLGMMREITALTKIRRSLKTEIVQFLGVTERSIGNWLNHRNVPAAIHTDKWFSEGNVLRQQLPQVKLGVSPQVPREP
jgi:hypothetical protein